jgi:hypothetical protein
MPSGIPLYEDYGDIEQWVKACTSHPEFRVLPSTGSISMSQVNTELGRPAAATINLQSAGVRNLTEGSRAYNTNISMGQLRGRTATQLAETRNLCIGNGVSGQFLPQGQICAYNYRTGVLYVGGLDAGNVQGQGAAAGADITSGAYNAEGLIVTGAEFKFTWNGNWYTVPVTQYPTVLNDWTGIFTVGAGFVAAGEAWIPHSYGGLKIGIP